MEMFQNVLSPTIIWAVLGMLLIIAEVFTGSFILVFFGSSALLVAFIRILGVTSFETNLAMFGVFGILGILLLRKRLKAALEKGGEYKADRGNYVSITENIAPSGEGRLSYQGSVWTAINTTSEPMKVGEKVVIDSVEGTKLFLTRR